MPRFPRAAFAVLLLVVAAACSDDDDDPSATPTTQDDASAEVDVRAELVPHPVSDISAVLEVEADAPVAVAVSVDGPGGAFELPESEEAEVHRIPIVGMRAESDYTVTVTAGGNEQVLDWSTGALPDDLPAVHAETSEPDRMTPGVTVLNAFAWDPVPEGVPAPDAGYVLAVDSDGFVVWYTRVAHQILDVDTTPRGTFLVTSGDSLILEIDLFGTVVRELGTRLATEFTVSDLQGRPFVSEDTTPIAIDSSHHEITELPSGNLVTLSTELIELDDTTAARLCPDNPEGTIVGDVVVELTPDGDVVHEWKLSDVYDPTEYTGSEMCIQGPPVAPPNWFYGDKGLTRDWSHADAVDVDVDGNALIVSARHFDGIFVLRYEDDAEGPAGELLYSFGVNGTLEVDGEPPNHQHAMERDGADTMLMYDNGNFRPGTTGAGGPEPSYSRAVQYEIDLEDGVVRQVWEHRDTWADGRPVYTAFLGDVDRHENGNVLITHGGGSTAEGAFQAKIIEVVPGDAPDGSADEVVFDLLVGAGTPSETGAPTGWSVYRSERLPSLYFGE